MYHNTDEWQMTPLDGNTGQAYMGVSQNEKVFFKRNTSPFIAALAAEGITPKLKWTQRTYSGDVLTAQEWKDGYLLTKEDMGSEAVIQLIRSIHDNHSLLNLLKRADAEEFSPKELLNLYYKDLPISLQNHQYFSKVAQRLAETIDNDFMTVTYVICHGDLNHNNFLMSANNHLYLVDWDNVKIADPLYDICFLLCRYFPPSEWIYWFNAYQFKQTDSFYKRVKWYSILACLNLIKQYFSEDRNYQLNETVLLLKNIYEK
ncbi:phosphotransferase family protein [Facklamia sp. DSM 111018]|uniref:Phosphotransferase family protein n=1 Tax=Facklamia lactis TaxID=2749967 RepID=A0ABS0LTY5_9LACT|nr:phosphotransferase family protein [Facklamia lactis]MBG9980873.1 phosphotransferase family protein [Facklamia lactis]MBG9986764.1 phosphotransferase family protein [Facklamia lactis]